MDILILLGLIFVNGLFVMSEIALVSARKPRLEFMADRGDAKARNALNLSQNPDLFLSAAQIGITLIAILTGVYSGERFGMYLKPVIEQIEPLRPYAKGVSTSIVVVVVTEGKELMCCKKEFGTAGVWRLILFLIFLSFAFNLIIIAVPLFPSLLIRIDHPL